MSRPQPSTAESLMRWLAAWLAVAVCMQALAIGSAALQAVTHRHGSLDVAPKPMLLWRHAGDHVESHTVHALAHAEGRAHQHAADDFSVLGDDTHAAAVAALLTAPAPHTQADAPAAHGGHVRVAAEPWSPTARTVSPPRHPPRA
jgi:hypothetical protein